MLKSKITVVVSLILAIIMCVSPCVAVTADIAVKPVTSGSFALLPTLECASGDDVVFLRNSDSDIETPPVPILPEDVEPFSAEKFGSVIRTTIKKREDAAVYTFSMTEQIANDDAFSEMIEASLESAYEHTGVGDEGDYLRWHVSGYRGSAGGYIKPSGDVIYTVTLELSYLTTAEQENTVTEKINDLYTELSLEGKSDLAKVRSIYDYLCANIVYDTDKTVGGLKHSAYAAIVNHKAVCQGYALLFYRLALMAGVDCRIVTSLEHAWNIVKLGDCYYNCDTTWDAMVTNYLYFLTGTESFEDANDHIREDRYLTTEYMTNYPISEKDYVLPTVETVEPADVTPFEAKDSKGHDKTSDDFSGEDVLFVFVKKVDDALTEFCDGLKKGHGKLSSKDIKTVFLLGSDLSDTDLATVESACENATVLRLNKASDPLLKTTGETDTVLLDWLEACGKERIVPENSVAFLKRSDDKLVLYYEIEEKSADVFVRQICTVDLSIPEPVPETVSVSMKISSYNPQNEVTVSLMQEKEVVASGKIDAGVGSGPVTQDFTLTEVAAGTYDLVITKAGHLAYTVTGVTVADEDIDLTSSDKAYANITMIAGDIDGDGKVNSSDWSILWGDANYLKSVEIAENKLADIDGDGKVNSSDWSILWSDANYLKSTSNTTFEY